MKSRKSQAALEFLMTYGWAILVVLVAIGALAYFGVLSPDKFLPAKCTLPAGIACVDFKVAKDIDTVTPLDQSGIDFVIRNSIGADMTGISISVVDKNTGTQICAANAVPLATLNNGQQTNPAYRTGSCGTLTVGSRFDGDVKFAYTNKDSLLTKTIEGTVTGEVQ
ncbi:MAG: hypothetical protein Q8R04_00465 [Nanoarchaeota archaeon]|nr:hypothetical protein [Nanoarchaeota archaeon]